MTELKENKVENVEEIKVELEKVKSERDQYKVAYEQAVEQNQNLWGIYSNLVDYVATSTIRKQK